MSFTFPLLQKLLGYLLSKADFTLLLLVVVLALIRGVQIVLREKKLPPGPWGVPFLGFLPFVKSPPHLLFTKLSRKYGSTFSFRFGSQLIVVLSDYKTIRSAFRKESFSGRPENEISQIIEGFGKKHNFYSLSTASTAKLFFCHRASFLIRLSLLCLFYIFFLM